MPREIQNALIDLATINDIGEELLDASNKHARTIGTYLATYGSAGYASAPDPMVVARKVVLSMQRSAIAKQRGGLGSRKYRAYAEKRSSGKPAWVQRYQSASIWSRAFLRRLIARLREQICGGKGAKKKGGTSSPKKPDKGGYGYALATSLASYIMNSMHISSSIALGLAALILLKVAQSTREAFCEMTDQEILAELLKRSS